ncbi:DUF6362 family protein [Devosia sp. YIM 151766]|uniref:DUF6362 family protein n=1 Tax=Devosia sp. YIM 151766 TaxID=3017325 RepID=UPI00255C75E2|nr:DUF6362 family protein [Devosia sp. YIM 151766]WIY52446.1 DUF6362 family protein [Devosia sp. YIM 151766]
MTDQFTPAWIEERFEQAVRTLRQLPNPRGSTPRGYTSSWPDYANDPGQSYGYHDARVRMVPSPKEIGAMEECFEWLGWLEPGDARIVWLRAEGRRWRQIGIRMGCVRQTAWRRWAAALITISKRLNKKHKAGEARSRAKNAPGESVVKPAPDVVRTLL